MTREELAAARASAEVLKEDAQRYCEWARAVMEESRRLVAAVGRSRKQRQGPTTEVV